MAIFDSNDFYGNFRLQQFLVAISGSRNFSGEILVLGIFLWEFSALGIFSWEFLALGIFFWKFLALEIFLWEFLALGIFGEFPAPGIFFGSRNFFLGNFRKTLQFFLPKLSNIFSLKILTFKIIFLKNYWVLENFFLQISTVLFFLRFRIFAFKFGSSKKF